MTLFSKKVISLYARGLTQRDIADFVKEQYNYQISAKSISNIIDTVSGRIKDWQSRPLEKIYPIVYMDALVYKVKQEGIYKDLAINKEVGYEELVKFDKKWSSTYPYIAKSWYDNWESLSVFFNYSEQIRKIIYTTNGIESFNQSLRKVTKHRGAFTSEEALMKIIFLQAERIEEKWNKPVKGWDLMLGQFYILFDDRLRKYLKE